MKHLARFPLAQLPTPLQRARRLEEALGSPPIWIKRDDLVGFALAGSKTRKLEFLVADALERGSDVLLTGGGPRSNHCQATAAAARVAGLGCRIVYYGVGPADEPTNLRLVRAFGADVVFTGDPERASVDRVLEAEAESLRAAGRSPTVIPRGGASPLGAVGYVLAAEELADQLVAVGVSAATLVVANGSSGTHAGLLVGAVGRPWRIVGAVTSRDPQESGARVVRLAEACAELLGVAAPEASSVVLRDARGPGYGDASAEAEAAAGLVARTEGIFLDPVFTAKAFATLVELIREGDAGPFVFLHTGGLGTAIDAFARGGEGNR